MNKKLKSVKGLTHIEIDEKIKQIKKEIFSSRIEKFTLGGDKMSKTAMMKKEIARLLTQKNQK